MKPLPPPTPEEKMAAAIAAWRADTYPPGSDSPWNRPLFVCACCERVEKNHDHLQRKGNERSIEPVCRYCERQRSDRPPEAGAFMDRRLATVLSALANTLSWEANNKAAGY